MSRLSIPDAKDKLAELESSLIRVRIMTGLLSSSDTEKERVLRHLEELLCDALDDFSKLEVGE